MSVPLLTCIANRISGLLKSPMSSTSMTWLRKHASNPWIQHVGVMRRVSTPVCKRPARIPGWYLGSESTPIVGARGQGAKAYTVVVVVQSNAMASLRDVTIAWQQGSY